MSHIRTSLNYIRRAPFQALAAIMSLALTFFVATCVALLVYASSQALTYFETRPQIIVFLKNQVSAEEISKLQKKLMADERVKDVHYVSKEKALEIYKEATTDNPLLGELVSPQTLPASIEFSVKELEVAETVIDEIKSDQIVDSVGFTASVGGESTLKEAIERLKNIGNYIRLSGAIILTVLTLTSLLVLMVVIGMRITTRRGEIETLSLLGAKPSFIRTPIVFEAISYAIYGSVVGWMVAVVLVMYITPSIIKFFGAVPILPKDTLQFFTLLGIILLAEIGVSIIIALMGSFIAISRAMSTKK